MTITHILSGLLCLAAVNSKPISVFDPVTHFPSDVERRDTRINANGDPNVIQERASCTNSPTDRSCWGDYDISTNYYDTIPDTGVIREYWLNVVEGEYSPDGVTRYAQTFNGSIPGPTLIADWGDTVVVHVTNSLTQSTNGTSIHFHGVRQLQTNEMDGVPSVTQCPIPPGSSFTYTWHAAQYGTSWYHSHFSLQAWEGAFGGIHINGPASANYDIDLGHIFLNDWSHETADALYPAVERTGPPELDNGLINGTNTYDGSGLRFEQTFNSNTSYRIRLVNGAIDSFFKFSIDNHTLTVIANDFVAIQPFQTDSISIGIGQRYDIIVTADQPIDNYWIRAVPQSTCSSNASPDNIRGILRYDSSSTTDPTSIGYDLGTDCNDMPTSDLVPYLELDSGDIVTQNFEELTVGQTSEKIFKWYLNGTTFLSEWNDPTLLRVYDNNTDWSGNGTLVLPDANVWVTLIIEIAIAATHPIHLHGHDFYVLAQGNGTYDDSVQLTTKNPTRRDVAILPANGYLVVAWITDNPGVWLTHCHIGWHQSMGLALQFIERQDEIVDSGTAVDTCEAWNSFANSEAIIQDDSGV